MEFYIKINKEVLAICDVEIMDKNEYIKINENYGFFLKEYIDFYKEKKVNETEALKQLKKAKNINAFGKNSISLLKKLNLVDENSIKKFNEIPHSQIYYLN